MKILLVLAIGIGVHGALHASPASFTPDAGPHAVGLRIVQQYATARIKALRTGS